jgi:hypothetical protein
LYWSNVCMVPESWVCRFFDIPDPENVFKNPDLYGDRVSYAILVVDAYVLMLSLVSFWKMRKS